MIRPERDQPLDERPFGRDPLSERATAFGGRDADERATRLLAGVPPGCASSAWPIMRNARIASAMALGEPSAGARSTGAFPCSCARSQARASPMR